MATSRAGSAPLAAYVLHSYDWSETSLIVELFTRERGRVVVAAKGAKRPTSQLRAVLLPFQRIHVSLGRLSAQEGASDIQTLRGAEWAGGVPATGGGAALFAGFYCNELLMKLLARHDPHERLFDAYAETLPALGDVDDAAVQATLRAFELVLLREIGLLPDLGRVTATQQPAREGERLVLSPEHGVVAAPPFGDAGVDGAVLAGLQAALDRGSLPALRQACAAALPPLRGLLRGLLAYHLGTSQLRTRQVMQSLLNL